MIPRRILCRSILTFVLCLTTAAASAQRSPKFQPSTEGVPNQYIVVLNDVPPEGVDAIVADLGRRHHVQVKDVWRKVLKGFWAEMTEATAAAMSTDLRVQLVQQNMYMHPSATQPTQNVQPKDGDNADSGTYPFTNPLWHLSRISKRGFGFSGDYVYSTDGTGVRIYVIDSGVLRFHQEFVDAGGSKDNDGEKKDPAMHLRVKEYSGSNVAPCDEYASSAPWSLAASGDACANPTRDSCTPNDDALTMHVPGEDAARYHNLIWHPVPRLSHGTSVASVAIGRNVGVAKGATVIPVKIIGCDGQGGRGHEAGIIAALEWISEQVEGKQASEEHPAFERKPSIVNMSTYRSIVPCAEWEGTPPDGRCVANLIGSLASLSPLETAVEALIAKGVPVVASANNNARDACNETPTRLSRSGGLGHVISVAGLAKDENRDRRWIDTLVENPGSNWGPCVDLWAPAEKIAVANTSAWDAYRPENASSGTSFAAPAVAGMIARMFSEDTQLAQDSIDDAKRSTVAEIVWKRLTEAAAPFAKEGLLSDHETDKAFQDKFLAAGKNPVTAEMFYASPRRRAYIGAFGITTQPQSAVLGAPIPTTMDCAPQPPNIFRVCTTTEPAGQTYQWYRGESGEDGVPVGTNSPELCVKTTPDSVCAQATANTKFWVRVKREMSGEIQTVDSAAATVVIDKPLITKQPASQWVLVDGAPATLTVEALAPLNTSPTYSWYRGHPEAAEQLPGASATFDVPVADGLRGYFAKVSLGPGREDKSEIAVVHACAPRAVMDPPFTLPDGRALQMLEGRLFSITFPEAEKGAQVAWFDSTTQPMKPLVDANNATVGNRHRVVLRRNANTQRIFVRMWLPCGYVEREIVLPPICNGFTVETGFGWDAGSFNGEVERRVLSGPNAETTLSVKGSPANGGLSYEWYRVENGNLVRLATNRPVLRARNGSTYRAVVSNGSCTIITDAVKLLTTPGCTLDPPVIAKPLQCPVDGSVTVPLAAGITRYEWWKGESDIGTPFQSGTSIDTHEAVLNVGSSADWGTYFLRVFAECVPKIEDTADTLLFQVVCPGPKRRAIHATYINSISGTVTPGDPVVLDVPDPEPDVTYKWYSDNPDEQNLGTGATTTVWPTRTTTYWAVGTKTCGPGVESSEEMERETIVVSCFPALSLDGPHDASTTFDSAGKASVSTSVGAFGRGPYRYQWHYENDDPIPNETGPSYTWKATTSTQTPATAHQNVYVVVRDACNPPLRSRTATLTAAVCDPPRITLTWGSGTVYIGGQAKEVGVVVEPAGSYSYHWYRGDGTFIKTTTTPSTHLTTYSLSTFYVKVTNSCGAVAYSNKIYLSVYGECLMPPLTVTQSATVIDPGKEVTFTALADFRDVHYQWYAGQSGDTRGERAADSGRPNQLTVSTPVSTYWVRASRPCGAFVDSQTLSFSTPSCKANFITQQPQSVDVAYGGTASLTVGAADAYRKSFTWFAASDTNTPVSSGSTFTRHNVVTSGRYVVRVSDTQCTSTHSGWSFPATIRVASCPSITPPQWVDEYNVQKGTRRTLTATAGGAIGYQWYRGEVGDTTNLLSGQTGPTYETDIVTADAQYWVRIFGTNGCIVDSPTINVRMCDLQIADNVPFNDNIARGQWVRFFVDAKGTGLQYQWYEGAPGDTSKPVGRPVDKLELQPMRTTRYWVRVTNSCGMEYVSPQYTASMCPIVTDAPTAASTKVMPGTTTTLNISGATGDELVYKWYIGNEPGVETTLIGQGQSIPTPPIHQTTTFWCKVISGECGVASQTVTVNVCDEPTVEWTNNNIGIAKGDMVTFRVNTTWTTDAPMITYYKGPKGNVGASQVVNQTTSTSFATAVDETSQYWARAAVGNCYADSSQLNVNVCVPKIAQQPVGGQYVANSGQPVRVSVTTDITPVSYEWWAGPVGNHFTSTRVPGGTGSFIDVSPAVNTTYWVRIKGCGTSSIDSLGALVTVCTKPTIVSQTASHWEPKDKTLDISVAANGTSPNYQWYEGNVGVTTKPVGFNQSFLRITTTATTTYWAKVSNSCGSVNSEAITISVCAPPQVTVSPTSQNVFPGDRATFIASATVATNTPLSYQWYSGTPAAPTILNGETSQTFITPPLTSGASYFVRVKSGTCETDAPVTVGMCTFPKEIYGTDDKKIQSGETRRLDLVISPVPTAYKWYRGMAGDISNPLTGWVSTRYIDVNPTTTTYYWAEVQGSDCPSKTRSIKVEVCVPKITSHPASDFVMAYGTKELQVASDMPNATYQWYSGTSGSGTLINGATSYKYTTPQLTAAANYWVKVTGSCGIGTNSNTATITICSPPAINGPPGSTSVAINTPVRLFVTATGDDLKYQWYQGTSGSGTLLPGKTNSYLDFTAQANTSYWVKVSGKCGTPQNSATAVISVCDTPVVQTHPLARQVIYGGKTASLSVVASQPTGSALEYQWFNAATGQAIPGETRSTFTTPPLWANASYYVRVSSGGNVCSVPSNVAEVQICDYGEVVSPIADRNVYVRQPVRLDLSTVSPLPTLVRWYAGASGDRSLPLTNWSTQRYYDTAPYTTTAYWAEFQNDNCASRTSTITLNVCVPQITQHPQSQYVAPGNGTRLTAATDLPGATFQWYQGAGTLLSGQINNYLDTGALYGNTSYWVRVTGSCGVSVDSTVASISMCTPPSIVYPPYDGGTGLPGRAAGSEVTANGSNLTYQWYYGESGNTSQPITGKTDRTMSIVISQTVKVWVRITGTCGVVNSPSTFLSVYPSIWSQPGDATLEHGQSASFEVGANGTYLSYKWYDGDQLIPNATGATYTTPPLYEPKLYRVLVFSGNKSVWSREAYVNPPSE